MTKQNKKKKNNNYTQIKCPRWILSFTLLLGGFFEVALFTLGKDFGYLGIIFLIMGAWIIYN